MAFVHLHNHTEYSLLDGLTHIKDMVRRAAELDMPAVAVTDHGVMSGMVELSDACDAVEKETGKRVKPIFGCEVYFTPDESLRKDVKPKLYHLLLLAKNNEGYHNLLKLVSESHVDNFYYKPRTTFSMLQKYGHGIIGSSACIAGVIPKLLDERRFDDAVEWARKFASCFDEGDFYIELQNQGIRTDAGFTQTELNHELTRVAKAAGLKTIATNDFHYLLKEDAEAQDIMLCIGTGSTVNQTNRMKLRERPVLHEDRRGNARGHEGLPRGLRQHRGSGGEVRRRVRARAHSAEVPPARGRDRGDRGSASACRRAWKSATAPRCPSASRSSADYEMGIIIQQGFPAYFLIVQEYIEWARSQGIGVGPGRGSAAGAIVAYAMGITDLDPMPNGLMFERFLSPERVEMPDIDVDFEQGRREEVINHIKDVYGEDHVSQVITFGTLQAKNAVRDSARVLDYPYGVGDRICKMIGDELGITIDKALETNPDLKKAYDTEEDVEAHHRRREVHRGPRARRGRARLRHHHLPRPHERSRAHEARHQGRRHHHPVRWSLHAGSGPVEDGLSGPAHPGRALHRLPQHRGALPARRSCPRRFPPTTRKPSSLMQSGNMDGLFQVEGALYVSLFKRLPPKQFSDVVASIALNRPGPLESGMVEDYIKAANEPGRRALLRRPPAPHPGRDPRHHGLPGADHADLHGHVRFFRWQVRQAAQGHGQEEARRHAPAAGRLEQGRRGQRLSRWRSRSRSGTTPRSSRSTPSTSRTRPPMPSSSCARPT